MAKTRLTARRTRGAKFTLMAFVCLLLVSVVCACAGNGYGDGDGNMFFYGVYAKYGVGEVEMEGESQSAKVGERVTLRAFDTDEYAFSHWEYLSKVVSTDREYTFKITRGDLYFKRYYAVFTPKDEGKALINVVYECGETIDEQLLRLERLIVDGGGYHNIGDGITLQSSNDGVGIARRFAYDGKVVDGPVLSLRVEKNTTVTVTIEKMVKLSIAENEHCDVSLDVGESFLKEGEYFTASMQMKSTEYVPDTWQIKDAITGEVLESYPWEENTELKSVVAHSEISLHNQLVVDLTCANENVIDTPNVKVISATGDAVQVEVEKPEKMILDRGFPMWVKPDDDTYLQNIYKFAPATEEFPFASRIDFVSVEQIYAEGGKIFVPDSTLSFGEGYEVRIEAMPRAKAAIVNIISDNEVIKKECEETGKRPSGYFAASLSTTFKIVEKGKEQLHQLDHYENLKAIYEVGFQFSHVEDENGRRVADNVDFCFTAEGDMNYYLKWVKKPVADPYFDYTLNMNRRGYVARLSQLCLFPQICPPIDEISLPYYYNGMPVTEVAEYGMSAYRCFPDKRGVEYYSYVPFGKINIPHTIEKLGNMAFASCFRLEVGMPAESGLWYIAPDAFWSPNDSVSANLTKTHLDLMLQRLHYRYIGKNDNFVCKIMGDEHFAENELAHYEALTEYVCVKKSAFDGDFSSFELCLLYHEFFHHYQLVAMIGIGDETLEALRIKPSAEDIEGWNLPYDTTDYEAYWSHPMEVSARAFAEEFSGYRLTYTGDSDAN